MRNVIEILTFGMSSITRVVGDSLVVSYKNIFLLFFSLLFMILSGFALKQSKRVQLELQLCFSVPGMEVVQSFILAPVFSGEVGRCERDWKQKELCVHLMVCSGWWWQGNGGVVIEVIAPVFNFNVETKYKALQFAIFFVLQY